MRIMIPQKKNLNGRDNEGESEDEEDEEDEDHLLGEEEVEVMQQKEGAKDNGIALNLVEYSSNGINNQPTPQLERNMDVF
jgi:hypothetical protein